MKSKDYELMEKANINGFGAKITGIGVDLGNLNKFFERHLENNPKNIIRIINRIQECCDFLEEKYNEKDLELFDVIHGRNLMEKLKYYALPNFKKSFKTFYNSTNKLVEKNQGNLNQCRKLLENVIEKLEPICLLAIEFRDLPMYREYRG